MRLQRILRDRALLIPRAISFGTESCFGNVCSSLNAQAVNFSTFDNLKLFEVLKVCFKPRSQRSQRYTGILRDLKNILASQKVWISKIIQNLREQSGIQWCDGYVVLVLCFRGSSIVGKSVFASRNRFFEAEFS